MSKWCAISECYFAGPHDHATSATTLYTSGTFKATALQLDTWGHCVRCGADTGSPDIWQPICPRCQQLAALEAEIGRAVIGLRLMESMMDRLEHVAYQQEDCHSTNEWVAAERLGATENQVDETTDELIAQWRKLHAEGAEAEAATERQEEK